MGGTKVRGLLDGQKRLTLLYTKSPVPSSKNFESQQFQNPCFRDIEPVRGVLLASLVLNQVTRGYATCRASRSLHIVLLGRDSRFVTCWKSRTEPTVTETGLLAAALISLTHVKLDSCGVHWQGASCVKLVWGE